MGPHPPPETDPGSDPSIPDASALDDPREPTATNPPPSPPGTTQAARAQADAPITPPADDKPESIREPKDDPGDDLFSAPDRRRPGRVLLSVTLVLVVAAIYVSGTWFNAEPPEPPSLQEIQDRLRNDDPTGDQGPYRSEITMPTMGTFSILVDPETLESVLTMEDGTLHTRGPHAIVTQGDQAQMTRDYTDEEEMMAMIGDLLPGIDLEDMAQVTSNQDLVYNGWFAFEENKFRLTLDEEHRFQTLEFLGLPGTPVVITYSYDDLEFPPFDKDAPRAPAEIPMIPTADQAPGKIYGIIMDELPDRVLPEELEIHFFDNQSQVVKTIRFDERLNYMEGFMFSWSDNTGSGYVEYLDGYSVQFPETVSHYRIFDVWAGVYVDEVERLEMPAPGIGLVLVVLLAGLALTGRRSPGLKERLQHSGKRSNEADSVPGREVHGTPRRGKRHAGRAHATDNGVFAFPARKPSFIQMDATHTDAPTPEKAQRRHANP